MSDYEGDGRFSKTINEDSEAESGVEKKSGCSSQGRIDDAVKLRSVEADDER